MGKKCCRNRSSEMYRDEKNNNNNHPRTPSKAPEPEFVVQWGKRIRCVRDRVKNPNFSAKSGSAGGGGIRQKVTSRIISDTNTSAAASAAATSADPSFSPFSRLNRVSDEVGRGKSASPEKEERYYTTRGAAVAVAGAGDESGRSNTEVNGGGVVGGGGGGGEGEKGKFIWPKLYITLSSKEKEADFLAMKGCKLPQRPKKRAKLVQRSLLFVSPGAWLSDMCQERYEVREKKTPKKRPRGLKAMGGILDSDSE